MARVGERALKACGRDTLLLAYATFISRCISRDALLSPSTEFPAFSFARTPNTLVNEPSIIRGDVVHDETRCRRELGGSRVSRINSRHRQVIRRYINSGGYVHVDVQRKSWSRNRVTTKYLDSLSRMYVRAYVCTWSLLANRFLYVCVSAWYALRVMNQSTSGTSRVSWVCRALEGASKNYGRFSALASEFKFREKSRQTHRDKKRSGERNKL